MRVDCHAVRVCGAPGRLRLPAKDEYRCPAGQRAIWRFTTLEHGLTLHKYWSSACPQCAIKAKCTTGENRRIARWEHEVFSIKCSGD